MVNGPNPPIDRVQARLAQQRAMVRALPQSTKATLKVLSVVQGVGIFIAGISTLGSLWGLFQGDSVKDLMPVAATALVAWAIVVGIEVAGRKLSNGASNWGTAVWS